MEKNGGAPRRSAQDRKHKGFILLLGLYEMAIYLSNDAYLPALPAVTQTLHVSQNLAQWTLAAWFMGATFIYLFLAPLANHFGHRPILLLGGVLFILASLGCAWAPDIYTLLIFRTIQGSTLASSLVTGYSIIHELFKQAPAIRALALVISIVVISTALGPLCGAFIMHLLNWRWIFILLALGSTPLVVGLFFKMPEIKKNQPQKININNSLKEYKHILSNKRFMLFTLTYQCFFASIVVWITAGPFLVIRSFHLLPFDFGLIQVLIFSGFIASGLMLKLLLKHFILSTIIWIGIYLFVIGGLHTFFSALIFPNTVWNIVIAMALLATGAGIAFPILGRLAIEASRETMGARVAMSFFLKSLSGMIGSLIIGLTDETLHSISFILLLLSTAAVIFQIITDYYAPYTKKFSQ